MLAPQLASGPAPTPKQPRHARKAKSRVCIARALHSNGTLRRETARLRPRSANSLLPLEMTFRRTQPPRHNSGETMATNAVMLAESPLGVEKRLWQAVIVTAIQEWISGPLRSKRQAEEYLFQDQKDFPVVCQSAGMDAERLRAKLNRLLRQNPALAASAGFLNR